MVIFLCVDPASGFMSEEKYLRIAAFASRAMHNLTCTLIDRTEVRLFLGQYFPVMFQNSEISYCYKEDTVKALYLHSDGATIEIGTKFGTHVQIHL